MKTLFFFTLATFFSIISHGQKTFILNARDNAKVEFGVDTNYILYEDKGKSIISKTQLAHLEETIRNDTDKNAFITYPGISSIQKLFIKNVPMLVGKYIIYDGQEFYSSYIPMIFVVDERYNITIIKTSHFYKSFIKNPADIVFLNK